MHHEPQNLFHDGELYDFLQAHVGKVLQDIDQRNEDYILTVSIDDLTRHLVEVYTLEPITLDEENKTADYGEAEVNKTHDPRYAIREWNRPILVPGMFFEYIIPFSGDIRLFKFRPSRYTLTIPRCCIVGSELRARFATVKNDANEIRNEFESLMKTIRIYLHASQEDVQRQNASLEHLVRTRIETRRAKLLKNRGTAEALGVPLRRTAGQDQTFSAPIKRKKMQFAAPKASSEPFKPEPAIEMEEYEFILKTIWNVAMVMERSPSVFIKMDEETIRQHILMQLNGWYEGMATGETFNGEGKTDILIRYQGKTVFIAECKFWTGPKGFIQTLDQIFSYTTWRDAKTAVVLFNRNKNTSAVFDQISELTRAYPSFQREVEGQPEGRFRFMMKLPNDQNRQITLTTMVFDVPV
jgi:hypothetical protein